MFGDVIVLASVCSLHCDPYGQVLSILFDMEHHDDL